MEQRDVRGHLVSRDRIMLLPKALYPGLDVAWKLGRDDQRRVVHISPRARRMANHLALFASCSSSVRAKAWPPVPSATK